MAIGNDLTPAAEPERTQAAEETAEAVEETAEAVEETAEAAEETAREAEPERTLAAEPETVQETESERSLAEPETTQTAEPETAQTTIESNGHPSNKPPRTPSPHQNPHPISQILWTWLLSLLTTTLFLLTVLYALGTTPLLNLRSIQASTSRTILILRLLSELTGLCLISLIDSSLERLQWMLAARPHGVALPGFIALALGTGKLGMVNLLLRGFRGGRRWSLLRLVLVLAVPAIGVVILSRVEAGLVFDEYASFPVAAGLGEFQPANVESWREIAALQLTTDFKNLLQNPLLAVRVPPLVTDRSRCNDSDIFAGREDCAISYFVHGGLALVTPPVVMNSSLPDAYVYVVKQMQGMQLDFTPINPEARFDPATDCIVAGSGGAAVQFCISTRDDGTTLDAQFVHCPSPISFDTACLDDTSWRTAPGWNTSLTIHRRSADIHFSRYNFTTVLLSNLSPQPTPTTPLSIPPASFLHVYNITFNSPGLSFSFNRPGQQFILYLSNYLGYAATSTSFGYLEASLYLRNLLALPLYYFQATYLSDAAAAITEDNVHLPNPAVPLELYTQAAFAVPSYRVRVARWSVWVYAVVGGVTIAVCVVVLVLGSLEVTAGGVPDVGLWPVLDFVTGCRVREGGGVGGDGGDVGDEGGGGGREEGGLRNSDELVRLRGLGWREEAREMGRIRVVAVAPVAG